MSCGHRTSRNGREAQVSSIGCRPRAGTGTERLCPHASRCFAGHPEFRRPLQRLVRCIAITVLLIMQVTEQRPRRRTRRVPHAEKQPEGEQPAKADVSERASGAADSSKALGKKLGAGEPPSALTPKVMAPVTLRQQNLRPPMLARPPALPPKPKLRQVSEFADFSPCMRAALCVHLRCLHW